MSLKYPAVVRKMLKSCSNLSAAVAVGWAGSTVASCSFTLGLMDGHGRVFGDIFTTMGRPVASWG